MLCMCMQCPHGVCDMHAVQYAVSVPYHSVHYLCAVGYVMIAVVYGRRFACVSAACNMLNAVFIQCHVMRPHGVLII